MTLNGSTDGSYSPAVNMALRMKLCTTDKQHELATEIGSKKCSSEQSHIHEEEDKQELQQNLQPILVEDQTGSFEKDKLQGCSPVH
jgi:hypothetical protein